MAKEIQIEGQENKQDKKASQTDRDSLYSFPSDIELKKLIKQEVSKQIIKTKRKPFVLNLGLNEITNPKGIRFPKRTSRYTFHTSRYLYSGGMNLRDFIGQDTHLYPTNWYDFVFIQDGISALINSEDKDNLNKLAKGLHDITASDGVVMIVEKLPESNRDSKNIFLQSMMIPELLLKAGFRRIEVQKVSLNKPNHRRITSSGTVYIATKAVESINLGPNILDPIKSLK